MRSMRRVAAAVAVSAVLGYTALPALAAFCCASAPSDTCCAKGSEDRDAALERAPCCKVAVAVKDATREQVMPRTSSGSAIVVPAAAPMSSPVLATFSIHTTPCVSRHPPVVVMQATDDRECHDTTVSLGHSRQRLFLPEALVWPRLVVEAGVLRDEAQKMAFAKHEDMVEQFEPESADKALGEGVHVRGPDRGANDLGADSFERAREPSTQVGVAIDDKHFGLDVQGCVSRLLRTPVIGRRPGDCSVHDSPSLQIEKEKDKEWRKSTSKVCTKSQAQVTWLRRKVLQRWPSPGTPFFMYRCTVRLRDPDSKLEQLTSKPLGAPPWVSRRHLADQHRVACRPSAA